MNNSTRISFFLGSTVIAAFTFLISCTDTSRMTSEKVELAKQPVYRSYQCTGSIADACTALGTTETTCNDLTAIDCQWLEGACIPETECVADASDETACNAIAANTAPITSCAWTEVPTCYGSISEACRTRGPTETACSEITNIPCRWHYGACIPSSDCGIDDQETCLYLIQETAPLQLCAWGLPPQNPHVCSGSIANACTALGTTETACNNLTTINCQWVGGACIPETDCGAAATNETACAAIASYTAPTTSCAWVEQSGSCSGEAYSVGEGQCAGFTDQTSCEAVGLFDGNQNPLFPAALCYWNSETGCHVKSTVCTEQPTYDFCSMASDRGYNMGLCVWTWE